jgi:hypothetical protein
MRGRRAWLAVAALALGGLLFSGCEKPPAADLEAARAALEDAKTASSGKWALPELAHAQALFDGASREMKEEIDRFTFSKDFSRVRALLAAARADAAGAAEAARRERDEARKEAGEAGRRARTMLEGARAAVQIAPSPRDGAGDLDRLRAELHAIEMELAEVDRLIAAEEFRQAEKKGSDLATRLQAALSRFFGRMEHRDLRSAAAHRECNSPCPDREALSLSRAHPPEGRPT